MTPAIVTLTKFPDVFTRLAASVDRYERDADKIVVTSGDYRIDAPGWTIAAGVEPFVFARNANRGLELAGERDVLLINDDCELVGPVLDRLREITLRHGPGLLSPQINGGVGNILQHWRVRKDEFYVSQERLAFVAIYLPWSTRRLVGPLDERFTGYGGDDRDYGARVQAAGLTLGITSRVVVKHGFGGQDASTSFRRVMTEGQRMRSMAAMDRLFEAKHAETAVYVGNRPRGSASASRAMDTERPPTAEASRQPAIGASPDAAG